MATNGRMTYDEAVAMIRLNRTYWTDSTMMEAKQAIYDLLDQFPGSEVYVLQNVRARTVDGELYFEDSGRGDSGRIAGRGCLKCQLTAWATGQPVDYQHQTYDYMMGRGVMCSYVMPEERWFTTMTPGCDGLRPFTAAAYTITEAWLLEYMQSRGKAGPCEE